MDKKRKEILKIAEAYVLLVEYFETAEETKIVFNAELAKKKVREMNRMYPLSESICFQHHFNVLKALIFPFFRNYEKIYIQYLGIALMYYPPVRMHSFLNYQKLNYSGDHDFVSLIEYPVYDFIVNNSPLNKNNDIRLEKLTEWVNLVNKKNKFAVN